MPKYALAFSPSMMMLKRAPISVAPPPVNSAAPIVSGSAQVGGILSCTTGTWSGVVSSYTYQWKINNVAIAGATSNNYVVQPLDAGSNIKCTVTAGNAGGDTSADSNTVGPILPAAPVNTGIPFVTGAARVGSTLTTTNGSWANDPTSYTYKWYRGSDEIVGATANVYTCATEDLGLLIKSEVTAVNAGGQATQASTPIGPVQPAP
jgi:hypothetical protein